MTIYFVSGHRDITEDEFKNHYIPQLDKALEEKSMFLIGDYQGADKMAQEYLKSKDASVIVYHMFENPKNNCGHPTIGGFKSDMRRDYSMTENSHVDIAWVREPFDIKDSNIISIILREENMHVNGKRVTGTEKNIMRRKMIQHL